MAQQQDEIEVMIGDCWVRQNPKKRRSSQLNAIKHVESIVIDDDDEIQIISEKKTRNNDEIQFISTKQPLSKNNSSIISLNTSDVVVLSEDKPKRKSIVNEIEVIEPPRQQTSSSSSSSLSSSSSSSSSSFSTSLTTSSRKHGDICVNNQWIDFDDFLFEKNEETTNNKRQWFCNVEGSEMIFNTEINDKIDKSYLWQIYCSWTTEHDGQVNKYEVNWQDFTQTNLVTKSTRKIGYRLIPLKKEPVKPLIEPENVQYNNNVENKKPWKQKGKRIGSGSHTCMKYTIKKSSLDSTDTRDQEEYNFAMAQLIRLLPQQLKNLPTKVEYYENDHLLKQFNKKKQHFENSSKKKHTPIWVFHGTNISNVESIMLKGFQVGGKKGTPIANGAAYGHGVYTAIGPQTPIGYSSSSPSYGFSHLISRMGQMFGGPQQQQPQKPGECTIILALALEGNVKGGHKSGVGDSWKPNKDWLILKDGAQLLPKYAITCQRI